MAMFRFGSELLVIFGIVIVKMPLSAFALTVSILLFSGNCQDFLKEVVLNVFVVSVA